MCHTANWHVCNDTFKHLYVCAGSGDLVEDTLKAGVTGIKIIHRIPVRSLSMNDVHRIFVRICMLLLVRSKATLNKPGQIAFALLQHLLMDLRKPGSVPVGKIAAVAESAIADVRVSRLSLAPYLDKPLVKLRSRRRLAATCLSIIKNAELPRKAVHALLESELGEYPDSACITKLFKANKE